MNCCICYEQITLKTTAILVGTDGRVVCKCEENICVCCAEKLNPKRCPTCRANFTSYYCIKKGTQLHTTILPSKPYHSCSYAPPYVPYNPTDESRVIEEEREQQRRREEESRRIIREEQRRKQEEEEEYERLFHLPRAPRPRNIRGGLNGTNFIRGQDIMIKDNDTRELYRARIIKVNNTGFTCQYYKTLKLQET
jgi:hypothetical protein